MTGSALSRALRWPVWSWRNLALTVAGLLVLGTAIGRLTGGSPDAADRARPAVRQTVADVRTTQPPATTTSTAAGSPAPAATVPSASAPSLDEGRADAAARSAAVVRAGQFSRAWLRPGSPAQRTAWLKPLATDRMVAQLAGLPASALTMRPLAAPTVVAVDQAEATVTLPMSDGRTAVLGMTAEADGWRVATLSTAPTAPTAPATQTSPASGAGG
jgi:hypothetical protein